MANMAGPDIIRQILTALEGLRFGSIEIVVHNGRIVQLERREKVRMAAEVTPPGK